MQHQFRRRGMLIDESQLAVGHEANVSPNLRVTGLTLDNVTAHPIRSQEQCNRSRHCSLSYGGGCPLAEQGAQPRSTLDQTHHVIPREVFPSPTPAILNRPVRVRWRGMIRTSSRNSAGTGATSAPLQPRGTPPCTSPSSNARGDNGGLSSQEGPSHVPGPGPIHYATRLSSPR
jgi:hypothetical protein